MERTQSLQFSSILAPNLPLENKDIAENQNFCKNYILRNIE